jgi:hypothetical protein
MSFAEGESLCLCGHTLCGGMRQQSRSDGVPGKKRSADNNWYGRASQSNFVASLCEARGELEPSGHGRTGPPRYEAHRRENRLSAANGASVPNS